MYVRRLACSWLQYSQLIIRVGDSLITNQWMFNWKVTWANISYRAHHILCCYNVQPHRWAGVWNRTRNPFSSRQFIQTLLVKTVWCLIKHNWSEFVAEVCVVVHEHSDLITKLEFVPLEGRLYVRESFSIAVFTRDTCTWGKLTFILYCVTFSIVNAFTSGDRVPCKHGISV